MRIVSREEFLNLPSGTVYRKYEPQVFDEINIKRETSYSKGLAIDWHYTSLSPCIGMVDDVLDVFPGIYRDGLYEDEQQFAVYSGDDVARFVEFLQESLCQ